MNKEQETQSNKSQTAECNIQNVSCSMADKAVMITALINTMDINKNQLGGYHSIRDSALEKLLKLIESIDI